MGDDAFAAHTASEVHAAASQVFTGLIDASDVIIGAYFGPNGTHFVYFVASDGTLRDEHWTGTSWQQDNFGVAVASGTSPSAYLA